MLRTLAIVVFGAALSANAAVVRRDDQLSSLKLCYSPNEEGCESCCRLTPTGVEFYTWTGNDPTQAPVTPWYNAVDTVENASGCGETAQCADCSARNLEEYQALLADGPPSGCVCGETLVTPIDACYQPKSCDCFCETYERVQTCEALIANGTSHLGPVLMPATVPVGGSR